MAFSFYLVSIHHNESVRISFQSDNEINLSIGDQSYSDLQLSSKSYISDYFLQLSLTDAQGSGSYTVSVFPDSIEPSMHALLRARIKTSTC